MASSRLFGVQSRRFDYETIEPDVTQVFYAVSGPEKNTSVSEFRKTHEQLCKNAFPSKESNTQEEKQVSKKQENQSKTEYLESRFFWIVPAVPESARAAQIFVWRSNFSATNFALSNLRHLPKDGRQKVAAPLCPVTLFPCFLALIIGRHSKRLLRPKLRQNGPHERFSDPFLFDPFCFDPFYV